MKISMYDVIISWHKKYNEIHRSKSSEGFYSSQEKFVKAMTFDATPDEYSIKTLETFFMFELQG